jgi:putative Mg2+ transporter-C (MgtC) family protein
MQLSLAEVAKHMIAALVAGGVIGTERSINGRAAGFRTHTLVCMAASILMLVTLFESQWLPLTSESIRMDPTRMAQGIMTGIGFLGAGVIFKEGLTVEGSRPRRRSGSPRRSASSWGRVCTPPALSPPR